MSEYASTNGNKPKSFSELFPGRFLHSDHLGERKFSLTIADVYREELKGEKTEIKAIVAFRETPLLLVLAKLNGLCFKAMFGDDVRKWIGRKVTLYRTDRYMPMNGEPAIRVWGSPELAKDQDVEIKMARRKPFTMTMHKVEPKTKAEEASERAPGEEG